MSQTEMHFGKLKRVETSLYPEQWCKQWCNDNGLTLASFHDSFKELFLDSRSNYKKYFFTGNDIYEAIEHTSLEEGDDLDFMQKNEDGTISFVNSFYNGGTCLSEVIEDGLKRIL